MRLYAAHLMQHHQRRPTKKHQEENTNKNAFRKKNIPETRPSMESNLLVLQPNTFLARKKLASSRSRSLLHIARLRAPAPAPAPAQTDHRVNSTWLSPPSLFLALACTPQVLSNRDKPYPSLKSYYPFTITNTI